MQLNQKFGLLESGFGEVAEARFLQGTGFFQLSVINYQLSVISVGFHFVQPNLRLLVVNC